jgi:hypothetical protein
MLMANVVGVAVCAVLVVGWKRARLALSLMLLLQSVGCVTDGPHASGDNAHAQIQEATDEDVETDIASQELDNDAPDEDGSADHDDPTGCPDPRTCGDPNGSLVGATH